METFYETFGFIAAVCAGIILLTLFFTALSLLKRTSRGRIVKVKDFISDGKLVNIHLSSGKSVLAVRFVGFTEAGAGKNAIPYQLANMLVCETAAGLRLLLRSDSVRMIEEVES